MRHWVVGLTVTGVGVALAKVVPTFVHDTLVQLVCYVIGFGIAFGGLFIIMVGMRKSASR